MHEDREYTSRLKYICIYFPLLAQTHSFAMPYPQVEYILVRDKNHVKGDTDSSLETNKTKSLTDLSKEREHEVVELRGWEV